MALLIKRNVYPSGPLWALLRPWARHAGLWARLCPLSITPATDYWGRIISHNRLTTSTIRVVSKVRTSHDICLSRNHFLSIDAVLYVSIRSLHFSTRLLIDILLVLSVKEWEGSMIYRASAAVKQFNQLNDEGEWACASKSRQYGYTTGAIRFLNRLQNSSCQFDRIIAYV